MRYPVLGLVAALALTACMKDAEDVAQDSGVLPSTCGSPGNRLQATVDGGSYCANGQVVATGDGASVVVTGVSLLGTTLILQIDSLSIGTQAITEASNGLLYLENGTSYVVMPTEAGSITITEADTSARTLKAHFNATLRNEMSGAARQVQGQVDVAWTE